MKIAFYNVENLFLQPGYDYQKSISKTTALAKTILEIDPDICLMCEVGGEISLNSFNYNYLTNQYITHIKKGNSDRGIELAALVSSSFGNEVDYISHKDHSINFNYPFEIERNLSSNEMLYPSHKFSRDCIGIKIGPNDNPKLIILFVHLKSKLDKDGVDPEGMLRREAEVKALINLYKTYQKQYPDTPIILSGDFNGNASPNNTDLEFKSIYQDTSLLELFDLMQIPEEQRLTHIYFTKNGVMKNSQLDYFFVPYSLKDKININGTGVYRYRDHLGALLRMPQHSYERAAMPSDHYPIVLELSI